MKRIKITVPGEPLSKSNALKMRFNYKTRQAETYYDSNIVEYEEKVKEYAIAAMEEGSYRMYSKGPVKLKIYYYLCSNRRKDLPNLDKSIADAMSGVVYDDDSQVVESHEYKLYDKENPRVEIEISRPTSTAVTEIYDYSLPNKYRK